MLCWIFGREQDLEFLKGRFSPSVESFMNVLKMTENIILYVGSNDHIQETGKELFYTRAQCTKFMHGCGP